MPYRLAELAEIVDGEIRGDPDRSIAAVRTLETAGPEDLSFFTSPGYREKAEASRAGALLVPPGTDIEGDLLIAEAPTYALAQLLELFHRPERPLPGIHPTAVLEPGSEVDPTAWVGAHAVIGAGSRVAGEVMVHPQVVMGRNCRVGLGAVLYPHVVLYDDTEIGERTVIHAGTVVGADGFGFVHHNGRHVKVPQVGRAVVEEDVEIGANSAVDRGTLEATRVGGGTKIDNLVQVGHNATIGRSCILCGQVGISGSASLGNGVVMGGQSGMGGHLTLADGAQVAGKASVFKNVEAGKSVAGTPAIDLSKWRRQVALLSRLETMKRRLDQLERKLQSMDGGEE